MAQSGAVLSAGDNDTELLTATPSIQIDRLSKRGRGRPRLDSVSTQFQVGVHGIVGRNGSGKSTFLRIIAGQEKADEGRVKYGGDLAASDVGYLPQSFAPPPSLTVREMAGYANFLHSGRIRADSVSSAIKTVDLHALARSQVARLSGGEQRRAGIAAVLASEPKVVILDEPTAGLDPEQRSLLLEAVARMADDRVILLSTHIASDVAEVCDSVSVLHDGKMVWVGPVQDLVEAGEGEAERGLVRLLKRSSES